MNLAITPINFNNQYSGTQNCRKSNNQNQNFGALKIKFNNTTGTNVPRITDEILDTFSGHFEAFAKRIGVDTDLFTKRGLYLNIFTDSRDEGALTGILNNMKNEPVCRHGHVLDCRIIDGAEQKTAEKFATKLKDINLDHIV